MGSVGLEETKTGLLLFFPGHLYRCRKKSSPNQGEGSFARTQRYSRRSCRRRSCRPPSRTTRTTSRTIRTVQMTRPSPPWGEVLFMCTVLMVLEVFLVVLEAVLQLLLLQLLRLQICVLVKLPSPPGERFSVYSRHMLFALSSMKLEVECPPKEAGKLERVGRKPFRVTLNSALEKVDPSRCRIRLSRRSCTCCWRFAEFNWINGCILSLWPCTCNG